MRPDPQLLAISRTIRCLGSACAPVLGSASASATMILGIHSVMSMEAAHMAVALGSRGSSPDREVVSAVVMRVAPPGRFSRCRSRPSFVLCERLRARACDSRARTGFRV